MLDWTDRHYRYFARILSRRALLYTEMVTTGAILHSGDAGRFLDYSPQEHPLVLQLGGGDPQALAQATQLATQVWHYDEINLNVGCPSDRVQNNAIGACLMADPARVALCFQAMQAQTDRPVTIKCRLGIDDQDEDQDLQRFIEVCAQAGCQHFIVHARKAWLQGLSPKENREIPPLNYARVYRLKADFPELCISLNGGIQTLAEAKAHLAYVDGVMLGRAAYQNPWLLAQVDQVLFHDEPNPLTRHQAIRRLYPYIETALSQGSRLNHITRHLLNIFQGCYGGKRFRRYLSEQAHLPNAGVEVLETALALVPEIPAP
ncbi:tRNA-dihydrouridine synthase A [Allopseudospirillum japonicum]|uniref:tRNA-dihydrouridine(20/20a) synthase n=2 Tax=Allopseudospirillum japonicum TaxID=64971 RepID=A0A1H6TZ73_9GAMM|nr:tRNA-dihydrouridine synthase A [Allopseudospirillum japonicum]